jgi:hypothetical protein
MGGGPRQWAEGGGRHTPCYANRPAALAMQQLKRLHSARTIYRAVRCTFVMEVYNLLGCGSMLATCASSLHVRRLAGAAAPPAGGPQAAAGWAAHMLVHWHGSVGGELHGSVDRAQRASNTGSRSHSPAGSRLHSPADTQASGTAGGPGRLGAAAAAGWAGGGAGLWLAGSAPAFSTGAANQSQKGACPSRCCARRPAAAPLHCGPPADLPPMRMPRATRAGTPGRSQPVLPPTAAST